MFDSLPHFNRTSAGDGDGVYITKYAPGIVAYLIHDACRKSGVSKAVVARVRGVWEEPSFIVVFRHVAALIALCTRLILQVLGSFSGIRAISRVIATILGAFSRVFGLRIPQRCRLVGLAPDATCLARTGHWISKRWNVSQLPFHAQFVVQLVVSDFKQDSLSPGEMAGTLCDNRMKSGVLWMSGCMLCRLLPVQDSKGITDAGLDADLVKQLKNNPYPILKQFKKFPQPADKRVIVSSSRRNAVKRARDSEGSGSASGSENDGNSSDDDAPRGDVEPKRAKYNKLDVATILARA
jgi:hypothetical protein